MDKSILLNLVETSCQFRKLLASDAITTQSAARTGNVMAADNAWIALRPYME